MLYVINVMKFGIKHVRMSSVEFWFKNENI